MSTLENKVVLITGASKGIGAGIAKAMAQAGAKVVVNYLQDKKAADAIVEQIRDADGTALSIQADITHVQEVKRLFQELKNAFGRLDVLVNNAGVYKFEPLELVTASEFNRQFTQNVWGTLLPIQESLNYFDQQGGSIINISSVASVKATPMSVLYTASKSAVDGMTRSLSKELASKKIRVNSILPGPTQTAGNPIEGTDMEGYIVGQTPLGRIGQPQDTSGLAVFLASDEAFWITGQKIVASGGFD